MDAFELIKKYENDEVHLFSDTKVGLSAIICVNDTRLGPALGGCRFVEYPSTEAAIEDGLRLARGMTYKAALAGLPQGGGKSVIIKPNIEFDRQALFESFGRCVESLQGKYITAQDSGTLLGDMDAIGNSTKHVMGRAAEQGGSGDPSPHTALGVARGIQACVHHALRRDLDGTNVCIQGVGNVGYHLCKELAAKGAKLIVADTDDRKANDIAQEFGAQVVPVAEAHAVDCDVYAPCALGGAINDRTLEGLKCRIVAGAANNQLAENHIGERLYQKGIIYAPDYVINAGGLISVSRELHGYSATETKERIEQIYDTITNILARSGKEQVPTNRIADQMVIERLTRA